MSTVGNGNSQTLSRSRLAQVQDDQATDDERKRVANQQDQQITARVSGKSTTTTSTTSDATVGQTQSVASTEESRSTSTIGATGAAALDRTASVDDIGAHQQVLGNAETRLAAASAPTVEITAATERAAASFATNLDTVMSSITANSKAATRASTDTGVATVTSTDTTTGETSQTSAEIDGLSADQLLAEFLKLNINDPNENVETHNDLYTLSSNLRLQALEEAKKLIENSQEQMKSAQKYADQAAIIGTVVQIAAIALTVVTFGAGVVVAGPMLAAGSTASAAASAGATAAVNMATTMATNGVAAAVIAAQVVSGGANYKAQDMSLDAQETANSAQRSFSRADEAQLRVTEESDIINTIVETKNQTVDTVMKMINASWSTRQNLMSATLAR